MSIDGILLVDKPEGISSARVVSIIKRRLNVKKVGHTGTLDPFATGLLPIAVGKATRLSRFYLGGNKAYEATVKLGEKTDTYDKTGEVVATAEPGCVDSLTPELIRAAVAEFQGDQEQVAPAFSALKHNGVPLYKLARQGKIVTKPPRQIHISDICVTRVELPEVDISVSCSGGTYIRSLAYDLGENLSCGAHLSALRRTSSGIFDISRAVTLDAIQEMDPETLASHILPPSQCVPFFPKLVVDEDAARKIGYGQALSTEEIGQVTDPTAEYIRLVDDNDHLLALVSPDKTGLTYNYCCVFIS